MLWGSPHPMPKGPVNGYAGADLATTLLHQEARVVGVEPCRGLVRLGGGHEIEHRLACRRWESPPFDTHCCTRDGLSYKLDLVGFGQVHGPNA